MSGESDPKKATFGQVTVRGRTERWTPTEPYEADVHGLRGQRGQFVKKDQT